MLSAIEQAGFIFLGAITSLQSYPRGKVLAIAMTQHRQDHNWPLTHHEDVEHPMPSLSNPLQVLRQALQASDQQSGAIQLPQLERNVSHALIPS